MDVTGGRGYIEKDWGQSFPRAWVWMQTNHFGATGTSLTASVAVIPWLRGAFNGFIAGLWHEKRLYRFATYTGARTERLTVTDTTVQWEIWQPHRRGPALRLSLLAERSTGGLLHSPERTEMMPRVMESLTATVSVRLEESPGGRVLFEGRGEHAGLEVVGELPVTSKSAGESDGGTRK